MSSLAIAAGEIRQRLREPGFLILLVALAAGTTMLVPGPHDDYSTLALGGNQLYGGSSFAGTSAGLDFGVFAGFFCIFALGTGFARDDRTHFSELLRAQPIRTIGLVLGRVLASWAFEPNTYRRDVAAWDHADLPRRGAAFQPISYMRNFLLLALPTTCFVASVAALLDVLLGRWRGFLIAAGLVGYIALLAVSAPNQSAAALTGAFDFSGLSATRAELQRTFGSAKQLSAGLEVGGRRGQAIFWDGLAPDARTVVERSETVALAALIGLLVAACYRRRAGVGLRGAKAIDPKAF